MLQNYLKIALRNLVRRRFYAVVTLFGLTVGLTFLLLIGNYISGELAVNKSLRHAGQQYLLQSQWKVKEMGYEIGSLAPMGPTLKRLYPSLVANYYRNYGVGAIVSSAHHHFKEVVQVGDSTLLTMFGLPMVYGNPQTALLEPNSIVITSTMARKYFGQTSVLGQKLTIQTPGAGKQLFTVTGVLEDLPNNSVTQLSGSGQAFIPMSSYGYFADKETLNAWDNRTLITYLELQPGISADQLTQPFVQTLTTYTPPKIRSNLRAYLSPLTTYYLKANNGMVEKMLLALSLTGLFILLMAVVNFVNITIGTSATRLREIGVRKVLGGLRKQLIGQFLTEALLLTTGATILALGCHELVRSSFADLLEQPVSSFVDWPPMAGVGLLGFVLFITLLAGFYPAFVLSNLPSVESLRGKLAVSGQKGIGLRQSLIVFQFTVAICVFAGAVVIGCQVTYFFSKDLGYQKAQIMTVSSVPRDWSPAGVQRMEGIRNQLARVPGVSDVSLSFEVPDGSSSGSVGIYAAGQDSTRAIIASTVTTDEQFAQTYGLKLKAGTFFHANRGSAYDSLRVVLNESTAKALGWTNPDKAIGHSVRFRGGTFQVSDILADFNFGSLHETIKPLVFIQVRQDPIYRYFSFRISPGKLAETVAAVGSEWARLFPDAPFAYAFMDDTLQKLYKTEIQLQKAARLATVLALLIVLLGIFGMVTLSVARRTKEVGIRKVLGASVPGIVGLFLREYALILLIANAIAWPAAYWFMTNWLAGYAYHISLTWSPFVLVGLGIVILTTGVVSIQVMQAALMNPVRSLRSE
ncbi:MAG: ABC transporter permease [Spirosoma sp.]|nr:ABC transporter permease [Spirosoma sp.]